MQLQQFLVKYEMSGIVSVESTPETPDISTLHVQDDDASEGNEDEEQDQDCEPNDDLHAENFKLKGHSLRNITNRHC